MSTIELCFRFRQVVLNHSFVPHNFNRRVGYNCPMLWRVALDTNDGTENTITMERKFGIRSSRPKVMSRETRVKSPKMLSHVTRILSSEVHRETKLIFVN